MNAKKFEILYTIDGNCLEIRTSEVWAVDSFSAEKFWRQVYGPRCNFVSIRRCT